MKKKSGFLKLDDSWCRFIQNLRYSMTRALLSGRPILILALWTDHVIQKLEQWFGNRNMLQAGRLHSVKTSMVMFKRLPEMLSHSVARCGANIFVSTLMKCRSRHL